MEKAWEDLREVVNKLTPDDWEPGLALVSQLMVDLDNRLRVLEGKPPK